jgi:triosephosphate isomerase
MKAGADMRTLVINFKNYREVLGRGSVRLSEAAASVASDCGHEIVVAPPISMLGAVASRVEIPVFSQSLGDEVGEKTTGASPPEAVRAAGGRGTLLNHSEARKPTAELKALVPRARAAGLRVCICAEGSREAAALSALRPEYVAVEPPELIGSGISVSRARPEVVESTVLAARKAGYKGRILCGAGIVDGVDVRKAVELGADGVLVSSSVVKAKDWEPKIRELARSLD